MYFQLLTQCLLVTQPKGLPPIIKPSVHLFVIDNWGQKIHKNSCNPLVALEIRDTEEVSKAEEIQHVLF